MARLFLLVLLLFAWTQDVHTAEERTQTVSEILKALNCTAAQTAGFHDFPNNAEAYEPVAFYEGAFTIKLNRALMRHINPEESADYFVTLSDDREHFELDCRQIRGTGGDPGVSCTNTPPSQLVLINTKTLRYTRTSIGGWTFASATENSAGDSIYVEYGTCEIN